MGVTFRLVNLDKEEAISFSKINTGTQLYELSGTIVAGNIVTWYLLANIGDRISFVYEDERHQKLFDNFYEVENFDQYTDVTTPVVEQLIEANILRRDDVIWIDEEDHLFLENLQNIFDPASKAYKE